MLAVVPVLHSSGSLLCRKYFAQGCLTPVFFTRVEASAEFVSKESTHLPCPAYPISHEILPIILLCLLLQARAGVWVGRKFRTQPRSKGWDFLSHLNSCRPRSDPAMSGRFFHEEDINERRASNPANPRINETAPDLYR
jgi:hypothetical protein